jgi:hypothetical protein
MVRRAVDKSHFIRPFQALPSRTRNNSFPSPSGRGWPHSLFTDILAGPTKLTNQFGKENTLKIGQFSAYNPHFALKIIINPRHREGMGDTLTQIQGLLLGAETI